MGIDLTGGLSDELEYVFAARPDDPKMRESVNVWLWDRDDRIGIPRIGIEAVADQWDTHNVQVNMAAGDGRVFSRYGMGEAHDPMSAQGRPTKLGAGPLSFECVEPFRHWRMRFDGVVHEWTCVEQIAGGSPQGEPSLQVQVEVELRSAVPPWANGGLLPEAKRVMEEQDEGALIGGPRFEQLARAHGTVRVGYVEYRIDGGVLCESAARASAVSGRSGATPGSRPCSRAAGHSDTWCSRNAMTASPHTTRASCSKATAISFRPGWSTRRGCAGSSLGATTCRW